MVVMDTDVIVDGLDQLREAVKDTATDSPCRQVGKPMLDQVEPGDAGGNEVSQETE